MIQPLRPLRWVTALAWLGAYTGCAGRAHTSEPAASTYQPAGVQQAAVDTATQDSVSWLKVDTAARTVALTLEVTSAPGAPSALLNGFRAGEAQVDVPLGWTVKWEWRSADSSAPHSLVVMVEREKMPLEGGRPSFSNAMTRMVTEGLAAGQTDQTTFVAEEAGWFWLLCGVPGHAVKGEWISLKVDREAKLPRVVIKKKA